MARITVAQLETRFYTLETRVNNMEKSINLITEILKDINDKVNAPVNPTPAVPTATIIKKPAETPVMEAPTEVPVVSEPKKHRMHYTWEKMMVGSIPCVVLNERIKKDEFKDFCKFMKEKYNLHYSTALTKEFGKSIQSGNRVIRTGVFQYIPA